MTLPLVVVSFEYDEEFDIRTQYRRYFKYAERANDYLALQRLKGNDAWIFKTDSEEFAWIKE
jgi:hypothetical protein